MKPYLIIGVAFLFAACSKREDVAQNDSLLYKPTPAMPLQATKEDTSGLVIDSFVARQQPEMEKLKHLEPKEVNEIYEAYRPLRHEKTSQTQIDSFARAHHITSDELHAILLEGDRLGWAGADKH